MNKINYLFLIVLFFSSILNTHATDNDTIATFKKSIDSLLVSFRNSPSNLKITKQLGGRKIKIKGTFDNGTKYFKHKIKYNGGVKKESIIVKHLRVKKNKLVLMKTVYINDEYFFLYKINYRSLEFGLKYSVETFAAEGVYKKVEFDANKKVYRKSYLWSISDPNKM